VTSLMQDTGTTHLAISGPMAIDNNFMLRVVVVPIARSPVTNFFTLILYLAYARFASAADVIGNLHEPKNVLLQVVSCYQRAGKGSTHVAQILHDVKEVIRLFVVVAHRIDSFFEHEILGNFSPHVLGPSFYSSRGAKISRNLVISTDEFGAAYAVIALPCDLLRSTSNTIHTDAVGTWWHIDNGPVFGSSIVRFTRVSPLHSFAVVVFGFLVEV
jgi:hypothetical protein